MSAFALVWPARGSQAVEVVATVVYAGVLLAAVPVVLVVVRRRYGSASTGPLWPIVAFVLLASAYAVLTPPWQTPDEPQHMVHVEVVRRAGPGAPVQLLPGARRGASAAAALAAADRDVVASMRATDATRWLPGARGSLAAASTPGPRELSHPGLYYDVAATLTWPLSAAGILARLAVLRAFGVCLAALTVWACGWAGRLLWPGRRLAEAPMVLALAVPTFASLGGAVTNDGLAVLCGALLIVILLAGILGRTRIAAPLPWAAAVTAVVLAGVFTKRTFAPLVVLVLFAVLVRARRRPLTVLSAVATVTLIVAVPFAISSEPRLALWEEQTSAVNYRCRDPLDGAWAICLPGGAPSIRQAIPLARAEKLNGLPLTLDFMVRSASAHETLVIQAATTSGPVASQLVDVSAQWHPWVLRGVAPAKIEGLWVDMSAFRGAGPVYVRNVRLGPTNSTGAIFSRPRNEVQNGSGATAVAGAPSFFPESVRRQVNSATQAGAALVHAPGTLVASVPILYRRMATTFSMSWATVGWQVPPPLFPDVLNWALAILVVAGLAGAAVSLLRARLSAFAGGLLFFSAIVPTAAVLFRDLPPAQPGIAHGRYLYPGLVAFVALLAAGFHHLWPGSERTFRLATAASVVVTQGLFLGLVFVPFLGK